MGVDRSFQFVCPACGESVTVDALVRDAILDAGCVVCGATVEPTDFTGTDSSS